MKNLKVSAKLSVGFLSMTFLILFIAAGGLYGLFRMGGISNDMYENKAAPLGNLAEAMEYFQRLRVQTRNAIIYSGDQEQLATVESDMNLRKDYFEAAMLAYQPTIASEEGQRLYSEIMKQFREVFAPGIAKVLEGARRGESVVELLESMTETTASANIIADDLSSLIQLRMDVMENANLESIRVEKLIFTVDMIVIAVTIAFAIFITRYISGMISKPMKHLYSFMERAGSTGDIRMTQEDEAAIREFSRYKDEIGQCIAAISRFLKHIDEISDELQMVSNGDLTIRIKPMSENDVMGIAVQKMVGNLNHIFGEVHQSTEQVTYGSKQVADGAQMLAQASAEQASAVEELSASVAEIARKTNASAEVAANAAALADTIKQNAEKGDSQMNHMMDAVKEINNASHSINKVIKVIDDIAFQTNILALNAAVEAARAGQHGKGFAVVAEEVRNLAAKSAEAARDTGGLITNSIEKAELGAQIADETSASLKEIVSGINESSQLIQRISQYSSEQVSGISQLNRGIGEVSQVTQRNSATAEQSSAASQEMSSQANILEGLIAQFKLADGGNARQAALGSGESPFALPGKTV